MNENIKEVLRYAVMVAAWRTGDISTEDGCFAATDLDNMIGLESAIHEAFGVEATEYKHIIQAINARRTIEVPLDPSEETDTPLITTALKGYCIGAPPKWYERSENYEADGMLTKYDRVLTVPSDLCKKIYKQMATMASGSSELEWPAPARTPEAQANDPV